ncbi:MAG: phage holin family protein [Clostridia bacterium]|nr:phage holin family protein [Clostridia bacterium]
MKKKKGGRWSVIFLCCTLAVPTVAAMMGAYAGTPTVEQLAPALATGALLGLAHILLRPALRLITAPLGCMTLGLFGMVIDVGLLYGCDALVEGFELPGLLCAVLTAVVINAVCAVAAGRR